MRYARWIASAVVLALMMIGAPNAVNAQDDRSGVEIWAQTCGNCHQNQPASRYTAEKWRSIIAHMRIVARLTDDEADAVLAFLTRGARGARGGDQGDEAESGERLIPAERYIEEVGGVQAKKPKQPKKPKKPGN